MTFTKARVDAIFESMPEETTLGELTALFMTIFDAYDIEPKKRALVIIELLAAVEILYQGENSTQH